MKNNSKFEIIISYDGPARIQYSGIYSTSVTIVNIPIDSNDKVIESISVDYPPNAILNGQKESLDNSN